MILRRFGSHSGSDDFSELPLLYYRVSYFILFLVFLAHVYAGVSLRGLYADGSYYLLSAITTDGFSIAESQRRICQMFMQLPLVLYFRLGGVRIESANLIFSSSLNLLPYLVLLPSLVLSRIFETRLYWILFFVATGLFPICSFAAVADANLATSYFFFVFTIICTNAVFFRSNFLIFLLSFPFLALHEVSFLFCTVLLILTQIRSLQEKTKGALLLLRSSQFILILSALRALVQILMPRSSENLDSLLMDLLHWNWVYTSTNAWNLPAVLMLGYFTLLFSLFFPKVPVKIISAVFATLAVVSAIGSFWFPELGSPYSQFAGRYIPAILSTAIGFLFCFRLKFLAKIKIQKLRYLLATIMTLGLSASLCVISSTLDWRQYVAVMKSTLHSCAGLISIDQLSETFSETDRAVVKRNACGWTNPTISVLLSDSGNVKCLIKNSKDVKWEPFEVHQITQISQSPFFETSPYLRSLSHDDSAKR